MALLARLPLNRICASQLCAAESPIDRFSRTIIRRIRLPPFSEWRNVSTLNDSSVREAKKKKKEENGVMKWTERFFGTCIFRLWPLVPFFLDFSACDACRKFASVFYCGQFLAADQPLTASYSPLSSASAPKQNPED